MPATGHRLPDHRLEIEGLPRFLSPTSTSTPEIASAIRMSRKVLGWRAKQAFHALRSFRLIEIDARFCRRNQERCGKTACIAAPYGPRAFRLARPSKEHAVTVERHRHPSSGRPRVARRSGQRHFPTRSFRATGRSVARTKPRHMKRRVKGLPNDPGLPVTGLRRSTRRPTAWLRVSETHAIDASFALAGEAVPFGHAPSGVHPVSETLTPPGTPTPPPTCLHPPPDILSLPSALPLCSSPLPPTTPFPSAQPGALYSSVQSERPPMIVGHNHHRLEKRIAAALFRGVPNSSEAKFLQEMSERLLRHGQNARLSDRQAKWLFVILNRSEKKEPPKPKPVPRQPSTADAQTARPGSFFAHDRLDLKDLLRSPQPPPKDSSPPPLAPPIPTPPPRASNPLRSEAVATPRPDAGAAIRRALKRGQQLQIHRERIKRQFPNSSPAWRSLYSPS